MKFNFELVTFSKSGKLKAHFYCEHCKQGNLYVGACLHTANLNYDPCENLNAACQEFVENINNRRFYMFDSKKAGKNLKTSVCNCSANVVSLEAHKAKRWAKAFLQVGLKKLENNSAKNTRRKRLPLLVGDDVNQKQ